MKTLPRSFVIFCYALAVASLLAACSKSSTPTPNVDVTAKTEQLKSPDTNTKVQALTELAAAGPKSAPAIPALLETLKDSDPLVRRLSAYALGEIGPAAKETIPALKEALNQGVQAGERDMVTSSMNAIRAIDPNEMPEGTLPNVVTPPGR
jgi:ABC-type oligopeptide transport system substrate-binding subunit